MEISKVAVIGAGLMGSGIAAHIANSGLPVTLLDIVPKGATNRNIVAETAVKNNWAGIVINGYVRDVAELNKLPIGIFAKGAVSKKTNKQNHGFEDILISFGSTIMTSGKWIYVDQNGWLIADKKLEL